MSGTLKFDYYYGIETEQFSFYRVPRLLVKDSRFKGLSSDAKLLYGLMLDRMSLSMKNEWLDEKNRAYIIYAVENIMEDLGCSKPTCIKIMRELDVENGIGLIEKKRRGLGKPDIIYVKNFASMPEKESGKKPDDTAVPAGTATEVKNLYFQKERFFTSEKEESSFQEGKETDFKGEKNFTSRSKETELPEVKDFYFQREKNFTSRSKETELPEVKNFYFWREKNFTSGSKETELPEVKEFDPNYNNINYNNTNYNNQNYMDVSYINPIHQSVENKDNPGTQGKEDRIDRIDETNTYPALIRKNLEYERHMKYDQYDEKEMYEEIYETICDVVCVKRSTIRINGEDYPYEPVKSRFLKLNSSHVEYVMLCMKNTATKITNIRAYLITALYNAPSTMNHYYQQAVQYDMHGGGWAEKGVI